MSYSFERIGKLLEKRGLLKLGTPLNATAWCLLLMQETLRYVLLP